MSQMTLTIDTDDTKVVREAAEMLLRLSGPAELAFSPSISRSGSHIGDAGVMLPTFCAEASGVAEASTSEYKPEAESIIPFLKMTESTHRQQVYTQTSYVDPSQAFGTNPLGATDGADTPPPPPPPATTTVELDSEGMPWDARIHTTARTKVANGTWKLARNTPNELVANVKAEYLGNVQSPTTSNVNTAEQQVAPITDVPPPPPPTTTGDPVRQFMSDIAKAGRMPSEINAALQKHGVQTLQLIRNYADKIPAIRLELGL